MYTNLIRVCHSFCKTDKTTKMATAFLESHLPADVVGMVSEYVHKSRMANVLISIPDHMCSVEAAFASTADPISTLKKNYPDAKIYVDDWVDWLTVVIKLTDSRFFFMFSFVEGSETEEMLVDAFIENNVVKIERLYYKSYHYMGDEFGCDYLEEYVRKKQSFFDNMVPFQYAMSAMTGKPIPWNRPNIDYKYSSGKKWCNGKQLFYKMCHHDWNKEDGAIHGPAF